MLSFTVLLTLVAPLLALAAPAKPGVNPFIGKNYYANSHYAAELEDTKAAFFAANDPFCATASPVYEEGIAYAISKLQFPNVHLYIDVSHGGWL